MTKANIECGARTQVMHYFNRAAATYQEAAFVPKEIASRLLDTIESMAIVTDTCRVVVDLGAACGVTTQALHDRFPKAHIFNIDIAWRMLLVGQQYVNENYVHGVAADGLLLPFPNESVDIVWANQVVHWVSTKVELFQEIKRVLKPEGCFVFSTMGLDTLQELRASWKVVDDCQHVNVFSDMHDVGDEVLRAGFDNPVMSHERLTVTYDNVRDLMHDLKASGVGVLGSERRRGLLGKRAWQQLIEEYNKHRLADGRLPATYDVIYGCGKKKKVS